MAKIRIYELAKELGLENRIIIDKVQELGLRKRASHSSSLDPEGADQVRRAVIRQAIGTSPESEQTTTRVDRLTGELDTFVEKRKGNVIRRRKKAVADELEHKDESEVAEVVVAEDASPSEEAAVETAAHEPATDGASSCEESAPAPETQAVETVDGDAEVAPAVAPDEQSAETAVESEEANPATVVETAPQAEAVEPEVSDGGKAAAEEAAEDETSTKGPRVLGRIDLPQKKPARTETKSTGNLAGRTEAVVEEEEEGRGGDRRKGRKRKGRRREFSRNDLVDYEGRAGKRGGRSGKGAPTARDDIHDHFGEESREGTVAPKASKRVVKIDEVITVGELARRMSLKAGEVIQKLIELGVMATINQVIDAETATLIAEELGFQVESTSFDEATVLESQESVSEAEELPRSPVVTVMGHVDHGKTSLLDAIRDTSVVQREYGGITQHIGAYSVELADGRFITFIDTPGHAAFTSMRARGAEVTDIVILVVAADDGVMPQTVEAVNHAKAADVPIVVAVNKMDKPGVNPDRVKQQLAELGLQPEDWGGDTMYYPVSALKHDGIGELLEGVLLVAELRELKAPRDLRARGTIIEARQDIGRGTVATVLVQHGTLKIGDIFVSGAEYGRVRSMLDHRGERLDEAGPSVPVEITGLNGAPLAGDDFVVVDSDSKARQVADNRREKRQLKEQQALGGPMTLEEFSKRAVEEQARELNVVLKADVHGSVEAVRESLDRIATEKVRVKVVHAAVGGVNESDVQLAIASKAIIIGFGVRAEQRALAEAEASGVQIRFYRVIYELIDEVKQGMAGLLDPIRREVDLGRLEVRDTFSVPKVGLIAGCYVQDGVIRRGTLLRLVRDSRVIHEGKLGSLRRFKDDVREVHHGYECGVGFEGFNDVKVGDSIEVYEIEEIAPTLE